MRWTGKSRSIGQILLLHDELHKTIRIFQNKLSETLFFVTVRLPFYIMHLIYWHSFTNVMLNLFSKLFLFKFPNTKGICNARKKNGFLKYFLLHKLYPISYQLPETADQPRFLPILRQQLNLSICSIHEYILRTITTIFILSFSHKVIPGGF